MEIDGEGVFLKCLFMKIIRNRKSRLVSALWVSLILYVQGRKVFSRHVAGSSPVKPKNSIA